MKNTIYKSIIILFAMLYGSFFALSFLSPYTIEKEARGFITQKVSEKTHERIDAIGSSKVFKHKIFKKAKDKLAKEKTKLLRYKILLHEKADEKMATVMAKMHNLDSESRDKHQKVFKGVLEDMVSSISKAIKNIESFMMKSYMQVMQKVLDDFKIFSGTNFVISFILAFLLFFKLENSNTLHVLAWIVILSTLICSYFYIFEQNWFFTILFNDFVGFWYVVYLFFVFCFFLDIVFNKARVTQFILELISYVINSVANAISS